jgi:cyanophycin synthetase
LIEIRLLEGANVYRLEPVVKLEVAVGRQRTWHGVREPGVREPGGREPGVREPGGREPGGRRIARLGAAVPGRQWPDEVAAIVAWARRLRAEYGERTDGLGVHVSSDPGHWVVAFPWSGHERARAIAEAAYRLAERSVSPVRSVRLTGTQERLVARAGERIASARTTPATWITDDARRIPIISITGTNGKSTVSRVISHILLLAGRHVGTTTSDGVLVDERLVEPGDWTGPGGAAQILGRSDVDVAVLETARGGILLRGIGYQSNEASILTNVSADHLDLQGIHTLPELTEVKATICRMTKPDGWVVLNGDDPYVAPVARRVGARVALFSIAAERPGAVRRHLAAGGRGYVVERGGLVELEGDRREEFAAIVEIPMTLGGLARHNVANALAAAAGARALGASVADVAHGLRDFRPDADRSPGRLNLFRAGNRLVIVDFAHNEAGLSAILDVAEGIAGGAAGRTSPITAIIGTAGDRPDDALRGIGRIAAERAQRIVVKETVTYLRGRTREAVVDELLAGVRSAGRPTDGIAVYESETAALRGELTASTTGPDGRPDAARVIVLMCHEERPDVFRLLDELGARPVDIASELTDLVPRLQDRPPR